MFRDIIRNDKHKFHRKIEKFKGSMVLLGGTEREVDNYKDIGPKARDFYSPGRRRVLCAARPG